MGRGDRVPAVSLRVFGKCSRMNKNGENMGFMLCTVPRRFKEGILPQSLVFRLRASAWMFGEGSVAIGVSNSVLFRVVGAQSIGFGRDPARIKSAW